MKKDLLSINVSIHGFDDITGRSLGLERKYNYDRWNETGGHIVLMERGNFAQVVRRLSDKEVKHSGAKYSLAIEWPNFNLIKEASKGAKMLKKQGTFRKSNLLEGGGVQDGSKYLVQRGKSSQKNYLEQPWSRLNAGRDPDSDNVEAYHSSELALSLTPRSLSKEIQLLTDKLHEMGGSLLHKKSVSSLKSTRRTSIVDDAMTEEEKQKKYWTNRNWFIVV